MIPVPPVAPLAPPIPIVDPRDSINDKTLMAAPPQPVATAKPSPQPAGFLSRITSKAVSVFSSFKTAVTKEREAINADKTKHAISLQEDSQQLAKTIATNLVEIDNKQLAAAQGELNKITGNPELAVILTYIAELLTEKLFTTNMEGWIDRKTFQEATICFMTTAAKNILYNIPEKERSNPPNPLLDIATHLMKVCAEHIEGEPTKKLEAFRKKISHIEHLYREEKQKAEREKALTDLFEPLSNALVNLAFPHGISGLGLGKISGFLEIGKTLLSSTMGASRWLGLAPLISKTLQEYNLPDFTNPALLVRTCYSLIIDPICELEHRQKRLQQTSGGRFLLHCAKLAGVGGPALIMNELLALKVPLMLTKLSPKKENETDEAYKARIESEMKQMQCKGWLARQLEGTAKSGHPMLEKGKELTGFAIEAVMSKIFITLAESNAGRILADNEDPLPYVVGHLKDFLLRSYANHGEKLKKEFVSRKEIYTEFREKSLRLATVKAIKLEIQNIKKKQNIPPSPAASASEIEIRIAAQPDLKRRDAELDVKENHAENLDWIDYSAALVNKEDVRKKIADYHSQTDATKIATECALKIEIDRLMRWMMEWEDKKERLDLVNDVFKPFADDLLKITEMKILTDQEKKELAAAGKPIPTGFRLNILGLDKVIEDSIPDGFCSLWELIICQFPGFMDWLLPEPVVKEKAAQLEKQTGLKAYSAIANVAAPIVTNLLRDLLKSNNEFLSKQTFEGINSQLPIDLQITDNTLQGYLKGTMGHTLITLAEKLPNQTTADTKETHADRKEADSKQVRSSHAGCSKEEGEVKFRQDNSQIKEEAADVELNTTEWIKNNSLWSFINTHVEETFLDILSANSNSIPRLVTQFVSSIHVLQKQLGATLAKEYANLPHAESKEYDNAVNGIFLAYKAQFIALTKDLLKKTGLDPLLKDIGKLGIFGLHEKILPTLPRACFDLHLKLSRFDLLDELLHDQLCEAIYDSNDAKQKIQNRNEKEAKEKEELHHLFVDALNPKGKSPEVRLKLWNQSGAHDQAFLIEQCTRFVSDLIMSTIRSSIHRNSETHAQAQINPKGFLGTYGLKERNELSTISEIIKSLTSEKMDESFTELWAFASRWLDAAIRQVIPNVLSSTESIIPKEDEAHRQWNIIGEVAIRIFKILDDSMASQYNAEGQKVAEVARKIKGEIALLNPNVKDQNEIEILCKRMAKLFNPITLALVSMAQGAKVAKPLHLIHGLPLPPSLKIHDKIDGILASFFDTMTLDNKPMIDRLFEIYGSHHVAEFCRVISIFTQHVSPFSLHENKDQIGKDLFESILALTKANKDLQSNLIKNRNGVEALVSHTIGLMGSKKDQNENILMNDVMQNRVWPFLQTYLHSFLLKVTVLFSEKMAHLQEKDPDITLKIITNVMQTFRKYLKAVHAATKAAGKSHLYELTQEEIFKFLAHTDLLDEAQPGSRNNIQAIAKTLKFDKDETPEDIQKRRIANFYVDFTKKIFAIFGFTEKDIPIPVFMQEPLFKLLADTLMPLCFNLMFKLMFNEDGKEAMLDKGFATLLHNIKFSDAALDEYTKKDLPPRKAVRIPDEHKAQRKEWNAKVYQESGEVFHESVQLIPEYLTQQALSLKKVKNMTTEQTAHVVKVVSDDWKPKKCLTKIAEICTESLLPGGKWSGDGQYDTTGLTPKVSLSAAEKSADEEMKARVAQEVKQDAAMEITKGTVKILRQVFKDLLGKMIDVLRWVCDKLFGQYAEAIHNLILAIFEYLGSLIDWTLSPLYLLLKLIGYGFAKLYTGLFLKNARHPAHIAAVLAASDTVANTFLESLKEHPFERESSVPLGIHIVGEADEKGMGLLGAPA